MTDSTPATDTERDEAELPFADIVDEITAEALRRRNSGDYPADVLEQLDTEFDRFAPLTYRRTGIDGAIRAVESASFINVDVPTNASRRPFEIVKQTVKRSTAWYHLHVARQVTTLGVQITRPLRMLADDAALTRDRLASIEERNGPIAGIRSAVAVGRLPLADIASDELAGWLEGADGPVLVHGVELEQVAGLLDHGVDAHAVARLDRAEIDAPERLDVRLAAVDDHFRSLEDSVLGAVVLAGPSVDVTSVDQRIALAMSALRTLRTGGRLVIAGSDPDSWAGVDDPVVDDIAPGEPLRAATWAALLTELGARSVRVVEDTGRCVVVASSA